MFEVAALVKVGSTGYLFFVRCCCCSGAGGGGQTWYYKNDAVNAIKIAKWVTSKP